MPKMFNSNPDAAAARSLFSKMLALIEMDDHERNMLICATVGISDEDLAVMVETSGLVLE